MMIVKERELYATQLYNMILVQGDFGIFFQHKFAITSFILWY